MSLAFTKFLDKAINDPLWGRLVVRSAQAPTGFDLGVRENLKADLAEAIAEGRLTTQDVDLAADIVIGIWLQVRRGSLERHNSPELTRQALDAVLRALGASFEGQSKSTARPWLLPAERISTESLQPNALW
jgi:hypothetical protein